MLQFMIAGAARILLQFYPAQIRRQTKAVLVAAKLGQFTAGEVGKDQPLRKPKESS